jgi:hypothetical protein
VHINPLAIDLPSFMRGPGSIYLPPAFESLILRDHYRFHRFECTVQHIDAAFEYRDGVDIGNRHRIGGNHHAAERTGLFSRFGRKQYISDSQKYFRIASKPPHRVEARRKGYDTVHRDCSVSCTDPENATIACRDPDRSAAIGRECKVT